jgi:hypothetical protein
MSLPFAIVLATAMVCGTVLTVVLLAFVWAWHHGG